MGAAGVREAGGPADADHLVELHAVESVDLHPAEVLRDSGRPCPPNASTPEALDFFVPGVNAVGYGLGPPALRWLAEQAGSGADPTCVGVALLVCPAACCIAAALLLAAARQREGGVRAGARVPEAAGAR